MLGQSFTDWEWVIVDNNSTDEGPRLATELADERVRFFSNPVPGPGSTRNVGLAQARGEWILFLDGDDLIEGDFLGELLEGAGEADLVTSPWTEFRDDDPVRSELKEPTRVGLEDSAIAFTAWAIHSTLIRRSWLGDHRWPEELDGFLAEDTAFWFRVVAGAEVAYCAYAGARYRTHTADCRSDYEPAAWFRGNRAAVGVNLAFLESCGKVPTCGQMKTLVHLFSGIYLQARAAEDLRTAEQALAEGQHWLEELRKTGESHPLPWKIRMLLGVKNFEVLRGITSFSA